MGSTLSANAGARIPGATYRFGWLADGVPVKVARPSTLTVGAGLLGKQLLLRATVTKKGYDPAWIIAEPVRVLPGVITAGSVKLLGPSGLGHALTAVASGWGKGVTLQYQWYKGVIPINGATNRALSISADDDESAFIAEVTATKPAYETVAVTTAPPTQNGLLPYEKTSVPVVHGCHAVGCIVYLMTGNWKPEPPRYGIRWTVDGEVVMNIDEPNETIGMWLDQSYLGKTVRVTIWGQVNGYATTPRTSESFVITN